MYYYQRKLLAAFISKAGGIIDLKTMIRASQEDTDDADTFLTDRRAMVTQARTAYGPGAYFKLDQLMDKIDDRNDPRSFSELISRITPPEFNPDGTVRRSGSIDVTGLSLSDTYDTDEYDDGDH